MHIHSLVFGAGLFALASCLPLAAAAQTAPPPAPRVFAPHDMARWGIPAGNYSGIAPLGGDRYALVSDKQEADGWLEVTILFSPEGDIERMTFEGAHLSSVEGSAVRDAEDIVTTEEGTLFVCAENDQRVLELDAQGRATGRELEVPEWCGVAHIFNNYGFEALALNPVDGSFWTTTEQSLRADALRGTDAESLSSDAADLGADAAPRPSGYGNLVPTVHRLLHFDKDMRYVGSCVYRSEAPRVGFAPRAYAFGVPAMTFAPDGTLYVMEREMAVARRYGGSFCRVSVFRVEPASTADDAPLVKHPVAGFSTRLHLVGRKDLANYEGMCFGPSLPDGRRILLLVADSQNRAGNSLFRLKDYIRVVVL